MDTDRDVDDQAEVEAEQTRAFKAKVEAAYAVADPDNPILHITGYGDDANVFTARDRDERERQQAQWERDRADHVNEPRSSADPRPLATTSAAPATRSRGRRTRRVGGHSARGSGRRADDPEPEPPPLARRPSAPLSRGAR
jgi:hypothetical protein